jgi:putative membrane protein
MSDLNDPRVLFAAERTLLAWSRTALTLMGFGFLIERFGLFLHLLGQQPSGAARGFSFWVGLVFIALGMAAAFFANLQYRRILRTLQPAEIPPGYFVNFGVATNLVLIVLGVVLIAYLLHGFY